MRNVLFFALLLGGLYLTLPLNGDEAPSASGVKAAPDSAVTFSPRERAMIQKMGGSITPDNQVHVRNIVLNPQSREIAFPGKTQCVNDMLEVLISTPSGRIHEALLVADINPKDLQLMCYLAGQRNGARLPGQNVVQGDGFKIEVQPKNGGRRPIEDWLYRAGSRTPIHPRTWVFVGSRFGENQQFLAEKEGNICLLWSEGNTVLDNPESDGDNDNNFFAFPEHLPPDVENGPLSVTIYLIPVQRPDSSLASEPIQPDSRKENKP